MKKFNNALMYEVRDVSFSYNLGTTAIEAIRNLSVNIPMSSLTTLSGPSGSGKSTLLNILGLIEPIQQGEVFFEGQKLSSLSEVERNLLRKHKIGFIFQHFHLIPVLTAEENIAYFLRRQRLPKGEIKNRLEETLEAVGLWEHRKKKPKEMSGGQMQRVAVARALAKQPDVIIGDEVTANLDQVNGRSIMEIFQKLVEEKKVGIILTTHDTMVQSYAQQNIHIQDGTLEHVSSLSQLVS